MSDANASAVDDATISSSETVVYRNPVIPGFAPDPSVVLVGDTFFSVTSSFHLFPGLPVYASKDLRTWTLIGEYEGITRFLLLITDVVAGNAINRVDQIDLSNATTQCFKLETGHTMVASAGLWAPTIRHHQGQFYIVCTNCTRGGEAFLTQNFYIQTEDIWSNTWSDPIFVDFKGIDPSLFFDDDGKVYFQGSWELTRKTQPSCTIKQFEIDLRTGRAVSEVREIWTGDAKHDTEGPHVYRKDDWYYLIVAEGGTFEHHMLSISRSRNIWGPFESYENNPILTSSLKDEYIQNTGHGELFCDADGCWWAIVLGIRAGKGGRCPISRESFLTAVDWPKNGWPRIHQPRMTFSRAGVASGKSGLNLALSEPTTGLTTSHDNVYIRNPDLARYSFPTAKDITLYSSAENLSVARGSCSFSGVRQRSIECTVQVTLHIDASNRATELQAGLAIYKDSYRHAAIFFNHQDARVWSMAVNKSRSDGTAVTWSEEVLNKPTMQFQICADEMEYRFAYRSAPEGTWIQLKTIDTSEMTARDFTGTVFGVYASGTGAGVGKNVHFENFEITST